MVVNEDTLESIIVDLRTKIDTSSLERHSLKELLYNAVSIQLIDVPDPTEEDPTRTKREVPIDIMLNAPFTPERREEIYNVLRIAHEA